MIKDILNSIRSLGDAGSVANKNTLLANAGSTEGLFEKLLAGFQKMEQPESLPGETKLDDYREKHSANNNPEIPDKRQLNEQIQPQATNSNTLLVGVVNVEALESEHAEESNQHLLSEDEEPAEKSPLSLKKIAPDAEVDNTSEMVIDTSGAAKQINADSDNEEDIVENFVSDNKIENSILADSQPNNEEQDSVDKADKGSVKVASPLQEVLTAEKRQTAGSTFAVVTELSDSQLKEAEAESFIPKLKNTPKVQVMKKGEDQSDLNLVLSSETKVEVKNELKENNSKIHSEINTSATADSLTQKAEEVLSVLNKPSISNQSTQTESSPLKQNQPKASDTVASQILKQQTGPVEFEFQQETAVKNDDSREKRYSSQSILGGGKDSLMGERLNTVANPRAGSRNESFSSKNQEWINVQTVNSKSTSLNEEQDMFFQEHVVEMSQTQEGYKSSNENSFARLGELPVANLMLRRSVLPGVVNGISKTAASEKGFTQIWQKHSFDLDDGSKIDLSTRNIDGVIQVKLASSSLELTRLLQQYEAEIKEHLEQECDINIDLQFNDNQDQDTSNLFDESSNGNKSTRIGNSSKVTNQQAEQSLQNNVRKFGYNRMEWTA